MKQLINNIKYLSVLLIIIGFFSCDEEDVAIEEVVAGFTYTLNNDTGLVTFINTSEGTTNYMWDFGDGTTSKEVNPTKKYPTGSYTVVLTASNVAGASATYKSEIFINIPLPISFPVDFDGANVKYDITTFNGSSFEIVDNPDPSGSNTSTSKVGAITNSGAAYEGFYFDLGTALDLSTLKTIKINVWSDKAVDVLLKLEKGSGNPIEVITSHTGSGWEDLYFTFDSTDSFSRITMFIDGAGTTAGTFYIDDISQIDTADIPCKETDLVLPIDFDCNGIDYTTKIVGNVSFTVVDNPQQSGVNAMATKVGQMTNTGQNWENAFFNLDTPVDFSTDKGIKMKFYSDQALPIKLKFEDGTENPVEADVNHTGSGWEELTFTLNSSGSYKDMVIFVDGPGTAAGTFYVDNIEQIQVDLPDPFDSGLLTNGDFENGASPWIIGVDDNATAPVVTNNGNSYYSIEVTNPDPNAPYAINLSQKLAITPDATYALTFDAWSDRDRNIVAGIGLSGGNFANTSEPVSITTTRQTYTLTLTANGFGDATSRVLFDLNSEAGMVNIDNVSLVLASTAPVVTTLLDFEDGVEFTGAFDGGANGSVIDNPDASGINTSAKVYQFNKVVGSAWYSGMYNVFGSNLDLSKGTKFKIKIWSPKANINVRFQLEKEGGGAITYQVDQTLAEANTWVELTFDFSSTALNVADGYDKIVIFPDYDESNQNAVATETIYYIDSITQE